MSILDPFEKHLWLSGMRHPVETDITSLSWCCSLSLSVVEVRKALWRLWDRLTRISGMIEANSPSSTSAVSWRGLKVIHKGMHKRWMQAKMMSVSCHPKLTISKLATGGRTMHPERWWSDYWLMNVTPRFAGFFENPRSTTILILIFQDLLKWSEMSPVQKNQYQS